MNFTKREYYKNIHVLDYIRLFIVSSINGIANLSFGIAINTIMANFQALYNKKQITSNVIKSILGIFTSNVMLSTLLKAILFCWITSRVLRFISKNLLLRVNFSIFQRINSLTAAFINQIPFKTYLSKHTGYVKEQIFNLDREFGKIIHTFFEHFVPELIFISMSFIKLYYYSKTFTLLILIWALINGCVVFVFTNFMKNYVKLQVECNSKRSGFYVEMCNMFLLTKFFKLQKLLTKKADTEYNIQYLKAGRNFWLFNSIMIITSSFITWLIVAVIGFHLLLSQLELNRITITGFVDLFNTMLWLSSAVFSASENLANIVSSFKTMNIGLEFMNENKSNTPKDTDIILNTNIESIEFNDVSLKYIQEEKINNENIKNEIAVFTEANFHIKKNDIITIVGPSGCGKTSIFNMLAGVIESTKGIIKINNINIDTINKDHLIDDIVYITQSYALMNDTVGYNIKLGNLNATEAEIDALITQLNLPSRDTQIGQAGAKLSGGQKQRICIARALLKYRPGNVILCDEITSSLDGTSSKYIIEYLVNLARKNGSILIFIDHSLSTIKYSNNIIFFEIDSNYNKRIVYDTHENLLKSNKFYQDNF